MALIFHFIRGGGHKLRWSAQLNINKVLNKDGPVPMRVTDDGRGHQPLVSSSEFTIHACRAEAKLRGTHSFMDPSTFLGPPVFLAMIVMASGLHAVLYGLLLPADFQAVAERPSALVAYRRVPRT